MFERDQEFLVRQYMFICEDPMDILTTEVAEEQYVGVFLSDLILNNQIQSRESNLRFDEYLINRRIKNKVELINYLEKTCYDSNERLFIKGLAVIQNDKLVGKLDLKEANYYSFFNESLITGNISIPHYEDENKFISLEIVRNKTKLDIFKEEREIIEKYTEEKIKKGCEELYKKYCIKGVDIFNLKENISIKYPKENLENLLNNLHLHVHVNVDLEGSSDVTNFY